METKPISLAEDIEVIKLQRKNMKQIVDSNLEHVLEGIEER